MTESMIERVARAIADQMGQPFDQLFADKRAWTAAQGIMNGRFIDVNGPYQDDYLDAARAALEAMREPNDAMVDAAVAMALQVSVAGEGGWSWYVADLHEQMIQAALNEQIVG